MTKNLIIALLVVVICILVYIVANFLTHYVYPRGYVPVRYDDLTLRTGDLLFILQYSSPHNFISGETFSHVAIVVVIKNIPYVVELSYPYVYCTPFQRRVMSVAEGQTFYIKSVNVNVNIDDAALLNILAEAQNIKYVRKVIGYVLKTLCLSSDTIISNVSNKKEGICSTFVLWFLYKLGLTQTLEDMKPPRLITWLSENYNKYHLPTRRIRFFDGTANVSFADHLRVVSSMFTNINPLRNVLSY